VSLLRRSDTKHQKMDEVNNYPQYLSHKDEPVDLYQKYREDDFIPKRGSSNLRNIFDDSDVVDNYWFSVARKHLRNS
jgi:hypothetical protein